MSVAGATPMPTRARVGILAAQAFALGLTTAWITIPASAIFLSVYGSRLLPVTYVGAGVAGAASSVALARAFRRAPVVAVASRVLTVLVVGLLGAWLLLTRADATWVAVLLLVFVPLLIPVGFVFIVAEAGMLLDVRSLKARYARVVAGFALGLVAGGLAVPRLLALLGHAGHLLAAAAAAAATFRALVTTARRRYPAELEVVDADEAEAHRPTLRVLVRHRYVMLIVAFQMLSAVESQWLDYLVLDRAARRYHDSSQLAQFVGRFSAIAYGSDVVFLLVVAGLLLRRFGLRYGLRANPIGVVALVGAVVAATAIQGSTATSVFALVVAARAADLTLSDGAARTSLGAAYQAVPARVRAVAAATVEGLAVPVAIGASGIVLLVVQAAGAAGGYALPLLTAVVVAVWTGVATVLAREYGTTLLTRLRGRTLDPADLVVDDDGALEAVERLVESTDEREVRLGLELLGRAEHPRAADRLTQLLDDPRAGVRADALERLAERAPLHAARSARSGLGDPAAAVRAASVRVLGRAGTASDAEEIAAYTGDDSEVDVAIAFALTRLGDERARERVAGQIARLGASARASDRVVAAEMLGASTPGSVDRAVLSRLLGDAAAEVARVALDALRAPEDRKLAPLAVTLLAARSTAARAVEALGRLGPSALPAIEAALHDPGVDRREHLLLVRVAREIGDREATELLRRHLNHRDRDVGLAVMTALADLARALPTVRHSGDAPDPTEAAVLRADLEHATHLVRALVVLDDRSPSAQHLRDALRDELALLRRRALALLSLRHGTVGMASVTFQLARRGGASGSLALEWLDMNLTGAERSVLALLEPETDSTRLRALTRDFPLRIVTEREVLLDMICDADDRWRRPWIVACAVVAAAGRHPLDFDRIAGLALERNASRGDGDATRLVRETVIGMRRRLA